MNEINERADSCLKKVLAKFGCAVIPAKVEGRDTSMPTRLYGDHPTSIELMYVRKASAVEWNEHRKFLRQVGVPVPQQLPPQFEPWVLKPLEE